MKRVRVDNQASFNITLRLPSPVELCNCFTRLDPERRAFPAVFHIHYIVASLFVRKVVLV